MCLKRRACVQRMCLPGVCERARGCAKASLPALAGRSAAGPRCGGMARTLLFFCLCKQQVSTTNIGWLHWAVRARHIPQPPQSRGAPQPSQLQPGRARGRPCAPLGRWRLGVLRRICFARGRQRRRGAQPVRGPDGPARSLLHCGAVNNNGVSRSRRRREWGGRRGVP